jgi:23S rRNA-/tRNA-specific pseudouridylate synthase
MPSRSRSLLLEHRCLAQQAMLALAPEDPTALAEGRIFVGKQRLRHADEQLDAGRVVTWYAPRALRDDDTKRIVLECREGIVAAAKPAAWSSEPDRTGTSTSFREQLKKLLAVAECHILTRLDVGVSGLVIAATNSESRQHLARVMAAGGHRRYLGIAAGHLPDQGLWQGTVGAPNAARARSATTHFECIRRLKLENGASLGQNTLPEVVSLLTLRPETGHRHQLRIHSSRAGTPLVGDRRYGGPHRFIDAEGRVLELERIYLHAVCRTVPLPSGSLWQPQCPVPEEFREFWLQLGGSPQDFPELGA